MVVVVVVARVIVVKMYCLCRSSKTIAVRIVLLDETDFMHELQVRNNNELMFLFVPCDFTNVLNKTCFFRAQHQQFNTF